MIAASRIQYLQERIARTEDQLAYKELYLEFYAWLHRFAMGLVHSKQVAEEIVSDVFIKIWEKRGSLARITNLKVYLYISTRNTALNYLQLQKRTNTFSLEDSPENAESLNLDPEQLMITAEMVSRIREAVNQLPPKCRLVFKLAKEDGFKYREVAEILHISVKTVENQLAIALQKIGLAVRFDLERSIYSPC